MSVDPTARPERRRNPRGEGARLRGEILKATHELVAGGENVTLRAIARRAGVAAPSIYRHFADLDAVMFTCAEQAFEELVSALTEQRDRGAGAADRLRAICDAYLDFAREKPHLYRLMFGGVWNAESALKAHPGEDRNLSELGMAAHRVLVEGIEDCVHAGVSDSDDPVRDAAALWVALHGLAQLRVTAPLFPWPPTMDRVLVTELARLTSAAEGDRGIR